MMFNRPHKAAQVFEKIRQVRPSKFFIAVDGARANRPGEAEKVQQCRAFKDMVDWDCDLKCNFAETNIGCRDRVASVITWAFEHVDELIILEDDCVPDVSFFRYCAELLEKYRDDNRIFTIAGSNQDYCEPFDESYGFSRGFYGWGWATWKRAWKFFDVDMNKWPKFRQDKYLKNIFRQHDRLHVQRVFQLTYERRTNTWDYNWWLNGLENHALHIVPKVNMVRNTGFEADGTHMLAPSIANLYMNEAMTFPLVHPDIMASLDRLFVPPSLSDEEVERTLTEYDAIFRQLLNLKQFHAVIILFKSILRQRLTDTMLTQHHLNYIYYAAMAYFNLSDWEHAEEMLRVLLAFSPQNVELMLFLTNVLIRQGSAAKAREVVLAMRRLKVNPQQQAAIESFAKALTNAQ